MSVTIGKDLSVQGIVYAQNFSGDGSMLTDVPFSSPVDTYKYFTDGSVQSTAGNLTDTFKFRGTQGVVVHITDGDITHGDNLLIGLQGVPNSSLANSSTNIAGNSTSLGGSVTQDQITGLSATGLIKRTAANTLAIAAAGSDYLIPATVLARAFCRC